MEEKGDVVLKTIEAYDEFAGDYVQRNSDVDRSRLFLDFFLDGLRSVPGKKLLDVGCAQGRDSKYLANYGYDVIGVDLSEKLLEIARKNAPNLKFCKMDMRNLEFPENSFDGIWAMASFLHIPKQEAKKTLGEFYRVLKKDSLLYICVKEGQGEESVKYPLGDKERFFAYYSPDEFSELIQAKDSNYDFEIARNMSSKETIRNIKWINIYARARK